MRGQTKHTYASVLLAASCQLALVTAGCGGDASESDDGATGGDNAGPVYAIGTSVFGQDTSSSYVRLVSDLDLDGSDIALDQAREFAGNSDVVVFNGSLLVADGDKPEIARYVVTDALGLEQAPPPVNFGNFGIASAAFWNHQFVRADQAYLVNGAAELIVWNPSTMEVTGTIALPTLEPRGGLRPVPGLADRSSVVHDGKFYLPLYWTDDSYADRTDDSVIVVIDVETDSVEDTLAANCPGLDYGTLDDEGQIHFSNWTGGPGTYYVLGTAQTCIATLDPVSATVTTKTFASITGGHEGAALKYAGGGRFVMSVFDEVRADAQSADEPFGIVGGLNWQLWSYDPATGDAAPITDVDWNSGAVIHSLIGDDLYSLVPGDGYQSTIAYRLDGDGGAEAAFRITGWSYRLFRVR